MPSGLFKASGNHAKRFRFSGDNSPGRYDYEMLSEVAANTGETIPRGIERANGREIIALERYKGKTFDHAFLEHESIEHERLIRAFKQEAEHGTNPEIRAYATKALPVIERHLHEVQDLLKSRA